MDMRDDTTSRNGGLDEGVQFFITTDGQLQMTGGNTLHLQIFGSIPSQLQHLQEGTIINNQSTFTIMFLNVIIS